MAFYLRKSFRMGPVRLNLSKSGLGVSAGVRGARVGINARGQSYVHAGRGGLYLRQNLTTQVRPRSSADPLTLYENTGVGHSSPLSGVPVSAPEGEFRPAHRGAWAIVAGVLFLAIEVVTGSIIIICGLSYLIWANRRNGVLKELKSMLNSHVLTEGSQPGMATIESYVREKALEQATVEAEYRRAYLAMCRRIVDDGVVTDSEIEALNAVGQKIGHNTPFARSARSDAFRTIYITAVADHDLTDQEEATLRHIRERLAVSDDDIREELSFIEQLKKLRRIRAGDVAPISSTHKLQKGEKCYFQAEGRFLKDKQLRSYTRDGQRYKVRGLVDDKEGTLLITNKRILLIHSGTSTVRHDKILDVDLDVDENVIRVTKDGSSAPTIIATPRALEAAAIIEAVSTGKIPV